MIQEESMITPLDIENKRFSKKTLNGYDPEEVDEFLDDLTKDYAEIYKKVTENEKEVEDMRSKLEHYTQIETTLQNTLLMAQSAAEEVRNAAQKHAEQIVKEAENHAQHATQNIDIQIAEKRRELDDVSKQFDVYKAKMESLLISQLELLKEINKNN